MKHLGVAIGFLTMSFPGFALKINLNCVIQQKENIAAFEASVETGSYQQTESLVKTTTSIEVDQILGLLGHKQIEDVDKMVIGIDYSGYSSLRLIRNEQGQVFVEKSTMIDDNVAGVTLSRTSTYQAPVEFLDGSFDSYLAGKEVKLRLTPKGEDVRLEQFKADYLYLANLGLRYKLADLYSLKHADMTAGEAIVVSTERKGHTLIKGNAKRLEIEASTVTLKLKVTLKISLKLFS